MSVVQIYQKFKYFLHPPIYIIRILNQISIKVQIIILTIYFKIETGKQEKKVRFMWSPLLHLIFSLGLWSL
jgi:hypothetical protein